MEGEGDGEVYTKSAGLVIEAGAENPSCAGAGVVEVSSCQEKSWEVFLVLDRFSAGRGDSKSKGLEVQSQAGRIGRPGNRSGPHPLPLPLPALR